MTQSSTTSSLRERIVLVNVRFSSGAGIKRRPAIIISVDSYHDAHGDAIVVPLTTNMANVRFGDHVLNDWQSAGLPMASMAKGFVETVERSMFGRALGTVSSNDLAAVEASIKRILGL